MHSPDYDQRAQQHRPHDAEQLAIEIRRLHANHLSARDIAAALHLDLGWVREALGNPKESRP